MENYFNYFTEIEEHFLRRRGGGLLLSTLDWALIETWKDAGIPLEAALRGIEAAFDRYDQRPSKTKRVNSVAYCSQEVLAAAEHKSRQVNRLLEYLDPRERQIIRLRNGLGNDRKPMTLEEIGNEMGITKERVRQLNVRIMKKLRDIAVEQHIEPV